MATNKRQPGFYKTKEIYLLSGLIFCGECGHALQGNHRPAYKNRPKYVTYRCGNRDRTKQCDNKEIRREYVEMYVLNQLGQRLFNDKAIPIWSKCLMNTSRNPTQSQPKKYQKWKSN